METGVSREQYLKLPGSARLMPEVDAPSLAATDAAVEVVVKCDSLKGELVPLRYQLRRSGAKNPVVAGRVTFRPDEEQWHTRGHVWIPLPAPGTYCVAVEMDPPQGYKGEPRCTDEFTIREPRAPASASDGTVPSRAKDRAARARGDVHRRGRVPGRLAAP